MTYGSSAVFGSVTSPVESITSDLIVTPKSQLIAAFTSEPITAVTSEMITAITYLTATESIAVVQSETAAGPPLPGPSPLPPPPLSPSPKTDPSRSPPELSSLDLSPSPLPPPSPSPPPDLSPFPQISRQIQSLSQACFAVTDWLAACVGHGQRCELLTTPGCTQGCTRAAGDFPP